MNPRLTLPRVPPFHAPSHAISRSNSGDHRLADGTMLLWVLAPATCRAWQHSAAVIRIPWWPSSLWVEISLYPRWKWIWTYMNSWIEVPWYQLRNNWAVPRLWSNPHLKTSDKFPFDTARSRTALARLVFSFPPPLLTWETALDLLLDSSDGPKTGREKATLLDSFKLPQNLNFGTAKVATI